MFGISKKCKVCGKKSDRFVKGMCPNCYSKEHFRNMTPEQKKKKRERESAKYHNDPEYRERKLNRIKKINNERFRTDPEYRKRRANDQVRWRKEKPIAFNKTMARCYLRNLPPKIIMELLNEIGFEYEKITKQEPKSK